MHPEMLAVMEDQWDQEAAEDRYLIQNQIPAVAVAVMLRLFRCNVKHTLK
ncbi:hypothetical protein CPter291_1382 [Collimonas pratensis]|uniref:Uncharacterized protein n=1 Tax=Collimonas pratensis TaxID=279113 RepID=A0ABM5Z3T7_9BURK|nr:hypothetical protein CPter291_1382 [Collimonas pratensis]